MRCRFNMNLCIFILIVFATTRDFVGAQETTSISACEYVIDIQKPQQFEEIVSASKDKIIIQFHTPRCSPCKILGPILAKKVIEQNGKIKLARMDIELTELMEVARQQGVRQVPVVFAYKNGKIVDKLIGFKDQKSVHDFVEKQLENI